MESRWTQILAAFGMSVLCASCLTTRRLQPDIDLQSVAEVMAHTHVQHRHSNIGLGPAAALAAFTGNLAQKRLDQLSIDRHGSPLPYSRCEYWPLVGMQEAWPEDVELLPASIDEVAREDLDRAKTIQPRGEPVREVVVEEEPPPQVSEDGELGIPGVDGEGEAPAPEAAPKSGKTDDKAGKKAKAKDKAGKKAKAKDKDKTEGEGEAAAPAQGEAPAEAGEGGEAPAAEAEAKAKAPPPDKPRDPLVERVAAIFSATADSVEDTICNYGDEGPRRDPPGFGMATPTPFESHDVWFRVDSTPVDRLDAFSPNLKLPGRDNEGGEELMIHGLLAPARYLDGPADLVIVIPGLFDSVEQAYVRDTMAAVQELGYSALALDMRGHGDTYRLDMAQNKRLDHGYSFGLFESDDILSIMETLWSEPLLSQVGNIYVIGYSAGGRVALLASELEASRPLVPDQTPTERRSWRVLAVNPMVRTQATLNDVRSPRFPLSAIFYRNPLGSIFAELVALRREFSTDPDAPPCIAKQMGPGVRASNTAGCGTKVLRTIRDTHIETYAKAEAGYTKLREFSDVAPFDASGRSAASQPLPARLISSAQRTTTLFSLSDNVVKPAQQKRFERGIYDLLGKRSECRKGGGRARVSRGLEAPECRQSIVGKAGGHIAYLAINGPLARQSLALWLADRIAPESWTENLAKSAPLDWLPQDGTSCWIGPLRRPSVGTVQPSNEKKDAAPE